MMVKPFENKTFDLLKSDVILNPVIKDGLSIIEDAGAAVEALVRGALRALQG
jgi:hypothetical protein